MTDASARAMARALARLRGEEIDESDDSFEDSSSEQPCDVPPSSAEVDAAVKTIAAWGRKPKAMKLLAKRVGDLRNQVGSRLDAVRSFVTSEKAEPLAVVPNVLPPRVAEAVLVVLRARDESGWHLVTAETDEGKESQGRGTTTQSFWGCSSEDAPSLQPVFNALSSLVPTQKAVLQLGRYRPGDFAGLHDDRAFLDIDGKEHSRDIAVVLHLTHDWTLDDGGSFIDHTGRKACAPSFNTMIAFRVPRLHEVTAVTKNTIRYSIYGWFYEVGQLYHLGRLKAPKTKRKTTRHKEVCSTSRKRAKVPTHA